METIPLHSSGTELHTWQGCIDKQLRTSSLVGFATETSGVELVHVSWISERDVLRSRVLSEEPLMLTSSWGGGQGWGLWKQPEDIKHVHFLLPETLTIWLCKRDLEKVSVRALRLTNVNWSYTCMRSSILYCSKTTKFSRLGLHLRAQPWQCTTYVLRELLSLVTNSRSNTSTCDIKRNKIILKCAWIEKTIMKTEWNWII